MRTWMDFLMFSVRQPFGITSPHCLPRAPSCFSLKPCLYAVRKMVQYGGKKKQGIWFTRYAYGHNIWPTQGIWPSCSLGCAGKPDAAHGPCVCVVFLSACRPGVNHQGTLPSPGQTTSSTPAPPFPSEIPSMWVLTLHGLVAFKSAVWSYSTGPTKNISKPHEQQKAAVATSSFSGGGKKKAKSVGITH